MNEIGAYFVAISSAAIISAIVKAVVGEKSVAGKMTRVVCGLFLAVTVLQPLVEIRIPDLTKYWESFSYTTQQSVMDAVNDSDTTLAQLIKDKSEAYILEEAKRLELDIGVEVKLDGDDPPKPEQVILSGNVSPYKKRLLSQYITNNFEIIEENQEWILTN